MFKPLSLFIGLRYTAAKRENNFISFISFVSIGGIALGVMTMIVVLSVMNGFQKEVAERSISMAFQNSVLSTEGYFEDWESLRLATKEAPNVIGSAPFTQGQGLVNHDGEMAPVTVVGIDPEHEAEVSPLADKIETANEAFTQLIPGSFDLLKDREFGVIVGVDIARNLNLDIGDTLSLITSDINVTVAGLAPRMKRLKVVGIFEIGMYEYDSSTMLMHINDAGRLFRIPQGAVEGLRLKLEDPMKARETAEYMYQHLMRGDILMHTWINQFSALFKMIEIEKLIMFIIMSLIVAVAVFNVVSMLVMVVTEKRSEIAILRTLGMSPANIMMIFMVQGIFIGFFGAIIGIILGLLIAFNVDDLVKWIEEFVGKTLFEPSVYPISEIPSEVLFSDVAIVAGIAFLLASIATIYPAWKAARTQPAEALRYE